MNSWEFVARKIRPRRERQNVNSAPQIRVADLAHVVEDLSVSEAIQGIHYALFPLIGGISALRAMLYKAQNDSEIAGRGGQGYDFGAYVADCLEDDLDTLGEIIWSLKQRAERDGELRTTPNDRHP